MNVDILSRLKDLKLDVEKSPDYGANATIRSKRLIDEVMRGLNQLQGRTMTGSLPVNNVLGKMMGGMNTSPFTKDRMTIARDIDTIKRKVTITKEINPQLTQFVNSRLDMIKGMR